MLHRVRLENMIPPLRQEEPPWCVSPAHRASASTPFGAPEAVQAAKGASRRGGLPRALVRGWPKRGLALIMLTAIRPAWQPAPCRG